MAVQYLVGDVRAVMPTLPDASVSLVATSPPFIALRSYLPDDHPMKHAEIGSEPDPATFLDTLLALTAEWGRVLAPWGSLAIELGDSYTGAGGYGGPDSLNPAYGGPKTEGHFEGRTAKRFKRTDDGWPRAKSLALIPHLYATSLAYGRNLLTGQPSPAGQWLVRNVIVWHRPNPAVGCVDDATEALTPDGWKRHDDLRDGDLIAAYDPATDSCRFLPAKFVRWHREHEQMIAIEKRKTSQRLTLDHRCLVRTRKRPDPFVVLAADLRNDQQVLLSARLEEVPGPEPIPPHRAELLGWYIAEGSPHNNQARIVQSLTANRPKVNRIRDLLIEDGADFVESGYRMTSGRSGGHVLATFTVKGELAAWLNLHHKRLPMAYVTTWPTRTLVALFAGLIDGDGHRRRAGGTLFFQKERQVCDAVQILAIRLGLRASVTRQEPMNGWQVTIGNPDHHESSRWTNIIKWDQPRGDSIPTEEYTGVVWCPMVETSFWLARRDGRTFVTGNSLGDKVRPSTSYITVATRSAKRWFDLDAVRTANPRVSEPGIVGTKVIASGLAGGWSPQNAAGAPPLDCWFDHHDTWTLTTQPSSLAHFAMWPAKLAERLILMMCPAEVCAECGVGRRRVTQQTAEYAAFRADKNALGRAEAGARVHAARGRDVGIADDVGLGWSNVDDTAARRGPKTVTLGWSDCGHGGNYVPGVVLDPFCGSGTTMAAAEFHGRDAIGVDIDSRNRDLYPQRREEVFRALNPTHVSTIDGQMGLFA